jgi:hypothetical protein
MSKTDVENKANELSNIDLIYHLLNKGTICYLPHEFDNELFIDKIMSWMLSENLEAQYDKEEQLHIIKYIHKSGMTNSIGLSMGFGLFMVLDQGKLFFDIKPEKWFEKKDSGFSLVKLVNDPRDKEIKDFIFKYVYDLASLSVSLKVDQRNHFIEKINEQKKIWFSTQFPTEDQLFVFLEISAIKKDNSQLNKDKNLKWFVVFSSSKATLVAFDLREQLIQQIDINPNSFVVKKELGRNPVFFNDFKLLGSRSNSELFYIIQHVYMLDPVNKIREIVRLNWLYKEKNELSNQYAIELQQFLIIKNPNPFDELSLFYMEYNSGDREKVFSKYAEDERLLGILHKILDHGDTYDILTYWIKKWNISYIDSVTLNNLLIKAVENAVQANNILPFYRFVRENFFKKNSEVLNTIIFDISFSKHLIKCGLGKEAKKILTKCLEKLPDETIMDLLPPKELDLTGNFAGQIIKVSVLEILSGLETEKEAIAIKCQIARLQPLVDERLDKIITVSDQKIAAKGKELKQLMLPGNMGISNIPNTKIKYKQLEKNLIEKNLRHPASRKNGSFSNFQKWIASAKVPDLTMLKSYTEKLSAQKHPELNDVVTDIKFALNIENVEVYISHGDKSVGITSYESVPQFLIVGGDHLIKESPNYLNINELRFAVAVEMAHLYFKHARITSSDIWKGAFEKSYFIVDSLLSIFPAVGMFSKSLQGIARLNQISSFLQKTEKIGKATSRSRDILKSSEQLVDVYKSKFIDDKNKDETKMEFLATSRIMQLTAHRCALVFTKDLKSAIRAMFLVSPKYYTELPVVEKYGLKEYLLKKNENETYSHQELAIRLADLFSFYLSEEYENVLKML